MFKWLSEMLSEQQQAEQTEARNRGQRQIEYQRLVGLALADKISRPDRQALVTLHAEFGIGGLAEMMGALLRRKLNGEQPASEACANDIKSHNSKCEAFAAETQRLERDHRDKMAARQTEHTAMTGRQYAELAGKRTEALKREADTAAIEHRFWRSLGLSDPAVVAEAARQQRAAEAKLEARRIRLCHGIVKSHDGRTIEHFMRSGVDRAMLDREFAKPDGMNDRDHQNLVAAFKEMGETGKRGRYLGTVATCVEHRDAKDWDLDLVSQRIDAGMRELEASCSSLVVWIRPERSNWCEMLKDRDPDVFVWVPLPDQGRELQGWLNMWRKEHAKWKSEREAKDKLAMAD